MLKVKQNWKVFDPYHAQMYLQMRGLNKVILVLS